MKITAQLSDEVILTELGSRLAAARIERNLTQAALAEQAGVSKRTIERLESGTVGAQLTGFLRVCRMLGLMDRLDAFLPELAPSPMMLLKHAGRRRQRASGSKAKGTPKKWTWAEPA